MILAGWNSKLDLLVDVAAVGAAGFGGAAVALLVFAVAVAEAIFWRVERLEGRLVP